MKNGNGFGGISKLGGKRRRPYWVRLTTGWEVNEKTGKAKQLYKTLGYYATRKEALLALSDYHKNPIDLINQDLTFADVYRIWTPKHFEQYPSSKGGIETAFSKYCASLHKMKMKDIRSVHLQNVMALAADKSDSTQKNVKKLISGNFKYCLENDILTKDYSQFLKITVSESDEEKARFFNKDELKLIFNNLDFVVDYPVTPKRLLPHNLTDTLVVMLYTGMRIGELIELKVSDIHLDDRYIDLRGTKTKAAKRIVPIHKDIIPIIEKRLNGKYLFEDVEGKQLEYRRWRRSFYIPFMESIGLTQTPHSTRHTFISAMDSCGVPASSVALKRIAGHSNQSVTEHYTHKDINELIETIDKLVLL